MKYQAFNPVLPEFEYIPDVEPRAFGDRLYLYGSHDLFGADNYCMGDYVCWSAPVSDLGNWKYEGEIFHVKDDPANADNKQQGFAPDCVKGKDGRYYFFYCLNRSSMVCVAVCDTPAGEYKFYGYVKHPDGSVYGSKPGDPFQFDPGVLIDDDGKVYLYTGFGYKKGKLYDMMKQYGKLIDGCYCVELSDDMLTLKSEIYHVLPGMNVSSGTGFEGHAFYEASSPRKINGKYYLVYSSELSHELCYAVSDSPCSGFKYGGTLISNGDIGLDGIADTGHANSYTGNNHGGLVEISGKWYIFYHRQTNKTQFSRQCCAEPLNLLPDGRFEQSEMTSCGLNSEPLKASGEYGAGIACNLYSKDGTYMYPSSMEKNEEDYSGHPYITQFGEGNNAQQYIADMRDGSCAGFKYFRFDGENIVTVKIRSSSKGVFKVCTGKNKEPFAEIPIESCNEIKRFSAKFNPLHGVFPVYFTWSGESAVDFKSFSFEKE